MSTLRAVVKGTLKPDGTLELDEKPNLPPGRVEVVLHLQEQPDQPRSSLLETLAQIHKEQQARGFKGLNQEEMDARIRELKDDTEYEEKWRQIWAQTQHPLPPEESP
jgi:hypothetical protein